MKLVGIIWNGYKENNVYGFSIKITESFFVFELQQQNNILLKIIVSLYYIPGFFTICRQFFYLPNISIKKNNLLKVQTIYLICHSTPLLMLKIYICCKYFFLSKKSVHILNYCKRFLWILKPILSWYHDLIKMLWLE